ncbi:MAG: hypothetical protein HOE30_08250 [Deltaproteobacteria bacterium]|nr:hypothetical protein [Deltaproteobacteria bacterium]MBT4263606.1 hypothetical protein [Deltaproteobacteria bacterium]MBT4638836.1 hypothetical protein [Deltaproteobacteria bacterium]MBT7154108.1 hypothetical protein [Deltaproteobacteria bacterium]MBT7713901.1 hypothetical protein [Deltaproteobacteria bacterium]
MIAITDTHIIGSSLLSKFTDFNKSAGFLSGFKCFDCCESDGALKLSIRKAVQGDTTLTDGEGRLATTMAVSAIDCMNIFTIMAKDDFDLITNFEFPPFHPQYSPYQLLHLL